MSWKLSRTVLRGGVTGNGGSLLGFPVADNRKQPYYIRLLNSGIMGFAGLWESWKDEDGVELETCCILTTAANEMMEPIHDRMLVILQPDDYSLWLDGNINDPHEFQRLYKPFSSEMLVAHVVPDLVNNLRFDSASCIVQM
jgi:putative SOS response-associated peptidase YedK